MLGGVSLLALSIGAISCNRRRGGGGGGAPSQSYSPELNGNPQEGLLVYAYGGQWSSPPTNFRFKRYRIDPATGTQTLIATVIQDSTTTGYENYQFTPGSADAYNGYDVTVEASFDNRGSWSAPVSCSKNMAYPSDVILPAIIPDPVLTWNAATGKFDLTQRPCQGLDRLYKIEDKNLSYVKQWGYMPRSETELQGTQSVDISGSTDPAPDPPIASMLPDDVLSIMDCTPDYQYVGQNNALFGAASNWVAATPTPAGSGGAYISRVKILNTGAKAWIPFFKLNRPGSGYTIAFTSGGTYQLQEGDVITGDTSTKTATVLKILTNGGSWATGNAAGYIIVASASGAFTAGETVHVGAHTDVMTLTADKVPIDILQARFPDSYPRFARSVAATQVKPWDPNYPSPLKFVDNNDTFTMGTIENGESVEFEIYVPFNDLSLLIGSIDGYPPLTAATITTYAPGSSTPTNTISFAPGSYTPNETKVQAL
jgi:hypothetical protein